MFDGNASTRTVVSGAIQVIAVVVVGLVASAVITAFQNDLRSAQVLATTAGALAVVVLAALVGWYATSTTESVERARKLQRRPYIKRVVADGIDRVLRWLDGSNQAWSTANPPMGMPVYPELDDIDVAEDVVADIARDHPDLVESVSEYITTSREYRQQWTRLHADLNRYIGKAFALEDPPETLDAVVPDRYAELDRTDDVDPWIDPDTFVRENSQLFARLVLENPPLSLNGTTYIGTEDYALLLLEEFREEFVELRGAEAVADQIEVVHRHLEDLKDGHEEIEAGLQSARVEYVDEYDLLETELGEVKHGGRSAV